MFMIFLQATEITKDQFWTGAAIIGGVLLLSYLVTKYTKFGGGSNYGGDGDNSNDSYDPF